MVGSFHTSSSFSKTDPASASHSDNRVQRTLNVVVTLSVAAYVVAYIAGARAFVFKTGLFPAFVLYAASLRHAKPFLSAWTPLIAGTILFDFLRGAIFIAIQNGYRPVYAHYVIRWESLLFGTPAAPLILQQWRSATLDLVTVFFHGAHFLFFLLFGLCLWHARPHWFAHYRRSLLGIMAVGLLGYFVVPTVPPWLAASQYDLLPAIPHIASGIYTRGLTEIYGSFDTNPVAAMPSLHAAFPTTCVAVGWQAFGPRIGVGLSVYAIAVMLSIIYLGEHYAVDIVAGVIAALAVVWMSTLYGRRKAAVTQAG